MIAFIQGTLADSFNRTCIVLTSTGVGYEILLPGHTFSQLPAKGEPVSFYLSLAVREDAQELFGFATFEERQAFGLLKSISKVGARTALAILSALRPEELRQAVLEDNIPLLSKVPGIGAKTAQHICLELKYKLASQTALRRKEEAREPGASSIFSDTMAALQNLGYAREECSRHVGEILKAEPDLDVGSAIRLALKALAKGKS